MRRGNASLYADDNSAGPWTRWKGTRTGRFVRFTETYLRPPRGVGNRKPMKLLAWEKEFAEALFAEDVTAAGLVMARGGGKSTLLGALGAFGGFEDGDQGAPVVPIVAVTLAQAKASIYSTIVSMVAHEPELSRRSIVFSGIGTERILIPRTEGLIFPRAADADALQGLDVYPFGIVDEWGHIDMAPWQAILMSRKRAGAKVIGAGTPGPDVETPLYEVRKLLREGGSIPGFHYREYSGEPGADIQDEENWRKANPSLDHGFPSMEFLRSAVVMSPEPFFRTYHLAEFDVSGHDSWLGVDARAIWRDLEAPYPLVDGAPTWIGVDLGMYFDSSAVVAVQDRPDGRLHVTSKVWMPEKRTSVDLADVMGYIRDLDKRFKVQGIAYDPRYLELEADRLAADGLKMNKVPQSVERMTPIVGNLFELIRTKKIAHDADDVLETHVVSAVPRVNERGYTLSKSKSSSRSHIDACIALALAVDQAQHRKPQRSPLAIGRA